MVLLMAATAAVAAVAAADAAATAAAADSPPLSLANRLLGLRFQNLGTTRRSTEFHVADVPCGYLEPENVTTPEFSWAQRGKCPFTFTTNRSQDSPSPPPPACGLQGSLMPKMDLADSNLASVMVGAGSEASACLPLCCNNSACSAFVFAPRSPNALGGCHRGKPCCYLKGHGVGAPRPSSIPGIVAAKVSGRSQDRDLIPPALGIRSAVPLGGIGAGSLELRGDGTLQQFTIWNNFPAGAPKFWAFPNALFGLKLGSQPAVALQTTPPAGIPGVEALNYSGAYPVSRLVVEEPKLLPPAVKVTLFAYSKYEVNDMNASSWPAVAFSLVPTQAHSCSDRFWFG
jgi:hypothetical protein